MMEKKRSIGVTVFASLTIISNGLLLFLPLLNYRKAWYVFSKFHPLRVQVLDGITALLMLAAIVAGFQILNLKEFGRKFILILSIVNIPFIVVGNLIYVSSKLRPITVIDVTLTVISILSSLVCIYFFTRPKVKDQFK